MEENSVKIDYRGSLTKIIEQFHSEGRDIPETILSNIDFKEKVVKDVLFDHDGRSTTVSVSEPLFINLIKNTSLDCYKKFMTIDWVEQVNYTDTVKAIPVALANKKYDFILEIFSMLDKTDVPQIKLIEYSRSIFEPILNIKTNLDRYDDFFSTKEDVAQYYSIFKEAFKRYPEFFNKIYYSHGQRNPKGLDENNWHKTGIEKLNIFGKMSEVDNLLCTNPLFVEIYKDIIDSYAGQEYGECTLLSVDNISDLLSNQNFEAINYLRDKGLLDKLRFMNAFDDYTEELIKQIYDHYDDEFSGFDKIFKKTGIAFAKIVNFYEKNDLIFTQNENFQKALVLLGNKDLRQKYLSDISELSFNISSNKEISSRDLIDLNKLSNYFIDTGFVQKPKTKWHKIALEKKISPNLLYLYMNKVDECKDFVLTKDNPLEKGEIVKLIFKNSDNLFQKSIGAEKIEIVMKKYFMDEVLNADYLSEIEVRGKGKDKKAKI